jgi:hypothetical protein
MTAGDNKTLSLCDLTHPVIAFFALVGVVTNKPPCIDDMLFQNRPKGCW